MRARDVLGSNTSFRLVGDPTNTILCVTSVKDDQGPKVLNARTRRAVQLSGDEIVDMVISHAVDNDRL